MNLAGKNEKGQIKILKILKGHWGLDFELVFPVPYPPIPIP